MTTPTEIENLRPVFLKILQAHQLSPEDLRYESCHIAVSDKGAYQCSYCHRVWSSKFSWICLHLRDLLITYRWKKKCRHCYIDCVPTFTVPQLEKMFEKAVLFYKKIPATEIENLRPAFEKILQDHELTAKDLRKDLCHITVSDKGKFESANCHRVWSSMFSWISLHLKDMEITYRWKMKCKQCYLDSTPTFTAEQLERMYEKAVKYYKGDQSAIMNFGPRKPRTTPRSEPHHPDLCEMCRWGKRPCWYRHFYPA